MSIFRSSLLFSLGTVLSRLSGLIREAVVAAVFGASAWLDAFMLANRIPNMLREMVAEGALGSSFTKVYSKVSEKDRERGQALLGQALIYFSLGMIALVAVGIAVAPLLVDALTLYADESRGAAYIDQAVELTRVLFPFIALMSLSAIVSGVLNREGKFFTTAVSPIFLNGGYIIGALVFARWFNGTDFFGAFYQGNLEILGLAAGVLLGGALQLGSQAAAIWKMILGSFAKEVRSKIHWEDFREVLFLMAPMVIGASATQINVLVNTNFATGLAVGSVVAMTFAFRLYQLPVGVFAVAVSSVILPKLSVAKEDQTEHGQVLQQASEIVLWLLTPCMAILVFSPEPLIHLIFTAGKFTKAAGTQVAEVLACFGLGIVGYGFVKILSAYYYSIDRTKFVMNVSLVSIVLNFGCNFFLVDWFGLKGIAATSATVVIINSIVLFIGIRPSSIGFAMGRFTKQIISASLGMALVGVALSWGPMAIPALDGIWFPRLFGITQDSTFGLKLSSLAHLAISGIITLAVFLPLASIALQMSPAQLVDSIKNRKKTT